MLVLNIGILLVSLFFIIKFSDLFVDASVSLAENYKLPKIVIALTVAAFCTCAPEFAISFNSISSGNADMTLANVIGSSIINILLIIGIAAIVRPIKLKEATIKKELPLLLIVTTAFFFLINDSFFGDYKNILSRADAVVLIIWFIAFCFYIHSITRKSFGLFYPKPKYTKKISIVHIIVSLIGIIIMSELIVDSAVYLAEVLNISQKIIAMTIIVIGTSLPELTITISSAKKNEFDIAIGNIIGTNIFNICVVLGLPIAIFGNVSSSAFNHVDLVVVLLAALLLYIFGRTDKELTRREGVFMLLVVIVYYMYIFIN